MMQIGAISSRFPTKGNNVKYSSGPPTVPFTEENKNVIHFPDSMCLA